MFEEIKFPELANADIVVCGGGITGVACALSAARQNARVVLLERTGTLGGMATSGLVSMFAPRSDGFRDLSKGICSEIIEEMCKRMGVEPNLEWQPINPEILKIILDEKVSEARIKLFFEVTVCAVSVQNARIQKIVCATTRGLEQITGKVFIDATGDAFIANGAGVPCDFGDEKSLPMSPSLCVQYCNVNPREEMFTTMSQRKIWLDLADKGKAPLPERHFVGVSLYNDTTGCGNLGHIYHVNTLDADDLTRSYIEGRKIAQIIHQFYRKYVPGFEKSQLCATASMLGVRESRRIHGDYTLTIGDYHSRAVFSDEIGRFNYAIDIHSSSTDQEEQKNVEKRMRDNAYGNGDSYGIPYRVMLPVGIENLLVPGRAVSADRALQSSVRVMPGCCITGQAAGIAAVLALPHSGDVRAIDVQELQRMIEKKYRTC